MTSSLVAIPAWNEEGSIADVIAKVRAHHEQVDILVVDDGSTDHTASLAVASGAQVVSLPFNVGVGGAMRTAFLYAQRHGYRAVVQVVVTATEAPTISKASTVVLAAAREGEILFRKVPGLA